MWLRTPLVWLLTAAACLSALVSCSDGTPTPGPSSPPPFVGHVHGLGVDPADQVLYVAGHGGVFRLTDGRLELVADRAQDTMGFTVVGPHHFLASGHPAPTDPDRPVHLGLVGVSEKGAVYQSADLGAHWIPAGRVPGTVEAFEAT